MKSGPRPNGNMKSGPRPNGNIKLTFSVKKWKMPTIKPKFSSAAAGNGIMKSGPRPNGNMKFWSRPNGNVKWKILGQVKTESFARPLMILNMKLIKLAYIYSTLFCMSDFISIAFPARCSCCHFFQQDIDLTRHAIHEYTNISCRLRTSAIQINKLFRTTAYEFSTRSHRLGAQSKNKIFVKTNSQNM
jgi:hypothetical protein